MSRRKRIQFWGSNQDDDHLVEEVLCGLKTATVCLEEEYDVPVGEFDDGGYRVGELVDVHDLRERKRCVIKMTDIYPFVFGEIPERLWRGENCTSAEHFQKAHRLCWPQHLLTDDRRLVAMHFELMKEK